MLTLRILWVCKNFTDFTRKRTGLYAGRVKAICVYILWVIKYLINYVTGGDLQMIICFYYFHPLCCSVQFVELNIFLQGSIEVIKKLDDVRVLESRKSARLMDQDTDFARLADMSDRKRSSSSQNAVEISG